MCIILQCDVCNNKFEEPLKEQQKIYRSGKSFDGEITSYWAELYVLCPICQSEVYYFVSS